MFTTHLLKSSPVCDIICTGDPVAQQAEHLTFNQGVVGSSPTRVTSGARVAELADALDLESSGLKPVWVQVPPLAPG